MAKTEKPEEKTEEKVEEKVEEKTETKSEEKTEKKEDEIPKEVLEAHKKFDEKIDSDEDEEPAKEDKTSEEKKPEDKKPADKKADEKKDADEKATEKKTAGEKEVADEKTPEDKEIEEAALKLEKKLEADEQKETEKQKAEKQEAGEKKVEEKKADEEKPYDCGLDPEEYEEDLIKSVNKLGQSLKDDIAALKGDKAELVDLVNQQKTDRYAEWLDGKIDRLGEDFVEILGEGELEDIEPGSEQFDNRMKIAARMSLVSKTYIELKKSVPSRSKLFSQAVSFLFNKQKNKSKTAKDTEDKLKDRAGQTIGSGSKTSSAQSATERVIQIQKDFDKKIDED